MTNPSIEEVVSLSREYNLIPVVTRLLADMETPIRLFQRFAEQDRAFLLESVEGGIQWARYSFIGSDPFLMISGKKGKIQVEVGGEKKQLSGKPVEEPESAAPFLPQSQAGRYAAVYGRSHRILRL